MQYVAHQLASHQNRQIGLEIRLRRQRERQPTPVRELEEIVEARRACIGHPNQHALELPLQALPFRVALYAVVCRIGTAREATH
jgi:hypothetical protein